MSVTQNAINSPSLSNIASANNSVLVTDSSGVGSLSTTLPSPVVSGLGFSGTFTPVMTMGGSATGFTYSTQSGQYTRIGNIVFITIVLVQTAKGSGTGAVVITGLPYNASVPGYIPFTGNAANQGSFPYTLSGIVSPASTTLYIYTQIFPPSGQNFLASTNVDIGNGNPTYMYFSGHYFTTDSP